ncbi:FecR domain-containing protein [Chitinophaga sp. YIM B06452]|uniref:FecR domain-containing protein n=1 Tax=Chitinophaga sp. YIM B06452 TaxID=3082158 RepID=UPI0031FEF66E
MENITDLLLKVVSGVATPEEEAHARRLMATDQTIRKEYDELLTIYHHPQFQPGLDNQELDRTFQKIVNKRSRVKTWAMSLAAAVLLFAGVFYYFTARKVPFSRVTATTPSQVAIKLSSGEEVVLTDSGMVKAGSALFRVSGGTASYQVEGTGSSNALNTLTVPKAKRYSIQISDGSILYLNAATVCKFPFIFQEKQREIYIDGEAFLEVAPDPSRPFLVQTPSGTVNVLGTSFNVNSYGPLTVSLQNGAISVNSHQQSVLLKPGQETVLNEKNGKLFVRDFDPDQRFSWREGVLHFDSTSIKDLAVQIERHYNIQVFIERKEIEKVEFRGIMEFDKPISKFLHNANAASDSQRFHWELDADGNLHIR